MTKAIIGGAVFALALVLLAVAFGHRAIVQDERPGAAAPHPAPVSAAAGQVRPGTDNDQGFLYGRVSTVDGATYEGRLRWGKGEEAFWGDYFNGAKRGNAWIDKVPPERRPKKKHSLEFFGLPIAEHETSIELARQLMVRFGDIARIEAVDRDVKVTLKSGAVFDLDRFEASDFDDGVRVWDAGGRPVDLDSLRVKSIDLLPVPKPGPGPYRLHGTVRTRSARFTGFIQWDREACVGSDELQVRTTEGERSLRLDTIRSIAHSADEGAHVTLLDGNEISLTGGVGRRGFYVDDPRYGRVLISWRAFENVEFDAAGSGPAYGEFPAGHTLQGTVTTREGARLAGRLVFDLDESETTETLDAPSAGVDYTIPFGLVASIVPSGRDDGDTRLAKVTLQNGEELLLDPAADLGQGNAGTLVFVEGREQPDYVPWADVARIDLERPPAMYPPLR